MHLSAFIKMIQVNYIFSYIIVLEYVSTGEYLLPPLIVTKEGYYYSGNHIKG